MLGRSDKKIGCLVVCDFTEEFQKLNPLIEYLEQQGYGVYCTAIMGQNALSCGSNHVSYSNWLHSIEIAFQDYSKNYDMLIVIGFSMGGLLALYLAEKYPIDALIVINAPVCYDDYKRLLKRWLNDFYSVDFTNTYDLLIGSKIIFFKMGYNLNKMIYRLKKRINEIRCPVLIIQGKKDKIVKWTGAYVLYEKVSATVKEIQFFPKSGHGICTDCEFNLVRIRIHQFIEKIAGNKLFIQSIANK